MLLLEFQILLLSKLNFYLMSKKSCPFYIVSFKLRRYLERFILKKSTQALLQIIVLILEGNSGRCARNERYLLFDMFQERYLLFDLFKAFDYIVFLINNCFCIILQSFCLSFLLSCPFYTETSVTKIDKTSWTYCNASNCRKNVNYRYLFDISTI